MIFTFLSPFRDLYDTMELRRQFFLIIAVIIIINVVGIT